MILRSLDACYTRGTAKNEEGVSEPVVYSAYQRGEILERTSYIKDGVEYARVRVIGRWKDYKQARDEVNIFNRKQYEQNQIVQN